MVDSSHKSFEVKDCALIAISTGLRAQTLRELRDKLHTVHPGSVYYHYWGGLMLPRFDDPEYNNDFASWAKHGLHDPVLAERLSVIDPSQFNDIESLRQETIEVIEERLDETPSVPWSKSDNQFYFIRSKIVIFNTQDKIDNPEELCSILPRLSTGSIFYHFIDARRRTDYRLDDLTAWLYGFEGRFDDLCESLKSVDYYFDTLTQLRETLTQVIRNYFGEEKNG